MLCLFAEAHACFLPSFRRIRHIFRMVTDSFYIVYYMEKGADTLLILNRKGCLVNFYQIIGDGMVQEINIFFHRIYSINILFIQSYQCIHGTVQVIGSKSRHTFQLFIHFHHCRCRIEHCLVSDILQGKIIPVVHFDVITRHKDIGELHDQPGKREKGYNLEYFEYGVGIRHKTAGIGARYHVQHIHDRIHSQLQDQIHENGTDHVEQEMNHRRTLGIFFTVQGGEKRRCTGAYITAQNDEKTDRKLQKALVCHEQHNADGYRRALDHCRQYRSHQYGEHGACKGGQDMDNFRHIPHSRHGA